jgi:hypothetical protein
MKDVLVAFGIGLFQITISCGGVIVFCISIIVSLSWCMFFLELEVVSEYAFVYLIVGYLVIGTPLLFLGEHIITQMSDWHEEYKLRKPHAEFFEYPDKFHVEVMWVDGDYKATLLTNYDKAVGKLDEIKAKLQAEVQEQKDEGK